MNDPKSSLDILGMKGISDSIHTLTEGAVDGASAFLSRICLPAAEEFGLMLRDRVSNWRQLNALKIVQAAEQKISADVQNLSAHPRIVLGIIEYGSWANSPEVQEMWSGLLAASCTEDEFDDSNLIFTDLLSRMTVAQAKLLNYACERSTKTVSSGGWIHAKELRLPLDTLCEISSLTDIHRIDRELDHLVSLGLLQPLGGGFDAYNTDANLTPSPLALHMYVRCQGQGGDPISFFGLTNSIPVDEF